MSEFEDLIKDFEQTGKIKPVVHVAFILDQSGSMGRIADDMLGIFNDQLRDLKNKSSVVDTKVTLVTFEDTVHEHYFDKDINDVEDLDEYRVGGLTALLDGIGTTVKRFLTIKELTDEDSDHSALFIVLTDGSENASYNYNGERLGSIISELDEGGKFTFTFLGVGDGFDIKNMASTVSSFAGASGSFGMSGQSSTGGFSPQNTISFNKNNMESLKTVVTAGIGDYYSERLKGKTMVRNFYDKGKQEGEWKTLMEAGYGGERKALEEEDES